MSYEEFLVSLGLAHSECAQVAFHAFDTKYQDSFDLRQVRAAPLSQLPSNSCSIAIPKAWF